MDYPKDLPVRLRKLFDCVTEDQYERLMIIKKEAISLIDKKELSSPEYLSLMGTLIGSYIKFLIPPNQRKMFMESLYTSIGKAEVEFDEKRREKEGN